MKPSEAILTLWEFWRTKRLLRSLRTPDDVRRHQARLLARQIGRIQTTIPFYREYAGRSFNRWPIMDKSSALGHFSDLNAHGVTAEEAWAAAETGLKSENKSGTVRGLTVGTSSGTSGNRGLFLVSPRERCMWLGSILAHAVPEFPWRSFRIALMLSTNNELYETTNGSGRLSFGYFDLRQGVEASMGRLRAMQPDILIAPPKALREVARLGGVRPSKVFSGGEVLDDLDAAYIREGLGVIPRNIYQATEGFLGIACEHGTIHLNEESMLFEWENVDPDGRRVSPIITDLRRTGQAMVRYRMNDVIHLSDAPCPCGCPRRAVKAVEGRRDDVLRLRGSAGEVMVLPDGIRTTLLDSSRQIDDFRVVQTGDDRIEVRLPAHCGSDLSGAVASRLAGYLMSMGAADPKVDVSLGIEVEYDRKVRRIIGRPWTSAGDGRTYP